MAANAYALCCTPTKHAFVISRRTGDEVTIRVTKTHEEVSDLIAVGFGCVTDTDRRLAIPVTDLAEN